MVFMKGSPNEPRCGFSRQLMGILQPIKVKFDTFDILEDEEVRQGLKTFSDWPTYPQVKTYFHVKHLMTDTREQEKVVYTNNTFLILFSFSLYSST